MSPGRPTDIGLQLGKACLHQVRLEGECCYFFCSFFFFHFLFLSYPCLSSHLLSLLSLFSLSLGDDTKWPTWSDVSLNSNTIKINLPNRSQRYGINDQHRARLVCNSLRWKDISRYRELKIQKCYLPSERRQLYQNIFRFPKNLLSLSLSLSLSNVQ